MTTIYNGVPLEVGDRIPGTALTFVQPILRRRGEFLCDCGKSAAYNLSQVERGLRKSCGCGWHRKDFVKNYIG